MVTAASESTIISIVIQLSMVHAEQLRRPINGEGGWQSFLRKMQKRLAPDNTIVLNATEYKRVRKYSRDYGKGGFETRLEGIILSIKDALE